MEARHFPITYRERFINGQLDMCLDRITRFNDGALAETVREHVERVRTRAAGLCQQEDGLRHGADYIIAAEPMHRPE